MSAGHRSERLLKEFETLGRNQYLNSLYGNIILRVLIHRGSVHSVVRQSNSKRLGVEIILSSDPQLFYSSSS